jgi:hypothetical protein
MGCSLEDHSAIVLPSHGAWQQALSPLLSTLIPSPQAAGQPERFSLIDDKAGNADALRKSLSKHGIDLICLHRQTRKKAP